MSTQTDSANTICPIQNIRNLFWSWNKTGQDFHINQKVMNILINRCHHHLQVWIVPLINISISSLQKNVTNKIHVDMCSEYHVAMYTREWWLEYKKRGVTINDYVMVIWVVGTRAFLGCSTKNNTNWSGIGDKNKYILAKNSKSFPLISSLFIKAHTS